MKKIVRFAPSPTGFLHVGNVRTALVNWLFARRNDGEFWLRMDDTDQDRSEERFEAAIREDLSWLGLNWETEVRQTDRLERYAQAKEQLLKAGRLYPCYETPEELDIRRKMQVSRGKPPIYDRAALKLTAEQRQEYEQMGRKPHYRFLLDEKDVTWKDLVRGEVVFHGAHASDPVLIRADGIPLYTFCSVVDDIDMNITHIIRGEDHVSNSAVQIQIFEALGCKNPPEFAHLALLRTKDGELSKRVGGGDIRSLREQGVFPLAITSMLARLGTSDSVDLADSLDSLVQDFDFSKFGRAAAQYDEEELFRLNERLLHKMPFAEAQPLLAERNLPNIDQAFWEVVRANIHNLDEVKIWWELVHSPIKPEILDADYCQQAANLLPEGEWDNNSWKQFTDAVKTATGRKGKDLFMPLRLALTARHDGPDLAQVFQLLGRDKALERLNYKG